MGKKKTEEEKEEGSKYLKEVTQDNCVVRVSQEERDDGILTIEVWKDARKNPDGTGAPNGRHKFPEKMGIDEAITEAIAHT